MTPCDSCYGRGVVEDTTWQRGMVACTRCRGRGTTGERPKLATENVADTPVTAEGLRTLIKERDVLLKALLVYAQGREDGAQARQALRSLGLWHTL